MILLLIIYYTLSFNIYSKKLNYFINSSVTYLSSFVHTLVTEVLTRPFMVGLILYYSKIIYDKSISHFIIIN